MRRRLKWIGFGLLTLGLLAVIYCRGDRQDEIAGRRIDVGRFSPGECSLRQDARWGWRLP